MLRGAVLALACLGSCSPAEAAATPATQPQAAAAEWLISPDGYGPIRIGMTPEEASLAYGHAFIADGVSDDMSVCETYHLADGAPHDGLRMLTHNGRVARVTDYGPPGLRTAEGVGVGSTGEAVRAAYPNAARRTAPYTGEPAYQLIAWRVPEQNGVLFSVGLDGVVSAVHAGDATILWIEGCL